MRDLLLTDDNIPLSEIVIKDTLTVGVNDSVQDLINFLLPSVLLYWILNKNLGKVLVSDGYLGSWTLRWCKSALLKPGSALFEPDSALSHLAITML